MSRIGLFLILAEYLMSGRDMIGTLNDVSDEFGGGFRDVPAP
jgi:hypothetical protein